MISYFELLQLIKDGKEPKRIKVHLAGRPREYYADYDFDEFTHYSLDGEVDENYRDYLAECFLESDMFDKKIEIIEAKGIEYLSDEERITNNEIIYKINEIIDIVNEMNKE